MLVDLNVFVSYNKKQDVGFDSEDLVNYYTIASPTGKKKFALKGTPGLHERLIIQPGFSPTRMLETFDFDTNLYTVVGTTVYSISDQYVVTPLGSLGTEEGFVSSASNTANQICLVDGQSGVVIQDGILTPITSDGFPASPLNIVNLDGYGVIPLGETDTFQISALNDFTQWDATDAARIQAYDGNIVGVGVVDRRLFFFKSDSTEVWYNQGATDFPFRRDNNLLFNFGCLTASSIVSRFGYLFWLSNDRNGSPSVMMTTGQDPQRVSNFAVDDLISTFSNPADMSAFIYKDDGHVFLQLSWTTDDKTLVYDVTMNKWHRMEMVPSKIVGSIPNSGKTRHLADCHAYFNGENVIGSYKGPIIYHYSRQYESNAGEPIKRQIVTGHTFDNGYNKVLVNGIQVDYVTGLGKVIGEYIDPKAYLSISRDGGRTFGNEVPASLGKMGQRKRRVRWLRKGWARDFVFKITNYSPVSPQVVLGGAIDMEVLE